MIIDKSSKLASKQTFDIFFKIVDYEFIFNNDMKKNKAYKILFNLIFVFNKKVL